MNVLILIFCSPRSSLNVYAQTQSGILFKKKILKAGPNPHLRLISFCKIPRSTQTQNNSTQISTNSTANTMSSYGTQNSAGQGTENVNDKQEENPQGQHVTLAEPKRKIEVKCKFGGCCNPACPSGTKKCWHTSPTECPFFRHFVESENSPDRRG